VSKENKTVVIVDAYGGDNAPLEIVKGSILAVNTYENLKVILCGNEVEIKHILSTLTYETNKIEIISANEVITNDDSPVEAIRTKVNSSLVVALEHLRKNDEICGLVSAGSTGAVLSGGFLKVGRLKGVSRPALAPVLPTINGKNVVLIDCGANMDATSENLAHFAIMGSLYMKTMYKIDAPRVALLNVGLEDKKGNELTKESYLKLKELPINFVGNMEARDALSGNYDVIVADGFSGNVLLKGIEGAVDSMFKMLKAEIKSTKMGLFGALFLKKTFKRFKVKLDHNNKGGSPFLGAKKIIIKSHGSSNAETIKISIKQVIDLFDAKMNEKLSIELEKLNNNKE
jgi:glycerol-3-phosphate acyltransferase PlsX